MHDFVASAIALRVHAGQGALQALPAELRRAGASRPLVLSGRQVHEATDLPQRLGALLGGPDGAQTPAWFAGLGKEAPLSSVQQAVVAARGAGADALVAVGAGSVLKAARVVAILLAEDRPVEDLVTRYPATGPAVSPRLAAPKLPIFNVLTAATSAQARAGSAVAVEGGDQRYEFFDPKTRPRAVFWDADALMTAPPGLALSTGASVYWRALMNIAVADTANPLVAGARRQAWRLACGAMDALVQGAPGPAPRIDLCAAALLQNRDEDDGGAPMQAHWTARLVYALGAAVFTLHPRVSQAAAYAALTGGALRATAALEPAVHRGLAQALGVAGTGVGPLAAAVAAAFARMGLPTDLQALGLRPDDLAALQHFAQKSFNADRHREFRQRPELLNAVLNAAWPA